MHRAASSAGLAFSLLLLAGCLDMDGGGPWSSGSSTVLRPSVYGWGNDGSSSSGRYVRSGGVTCDRKTELCYKRGHIDTSETREVFGRGAARDADAIRDELGTSHVYIPRNRNNSYCINKDKTCFKNGQPDWSDTRDVYGKKAGRRLKAKKDD
jgi:hypothetical protein